MRIAAISDIHGNLDALQRTLERVRQEGAQMIVCLGDIAGYGPFPNECIDLVRQECELTVVGNHDAGAVGNLTPLAFNTEGRAAVEWTRQQLTESNANFIKELPLARVSHDITFVHASPRRPQNWEYVATWREAAQMFNHFATGTCCLGHTHIPAIVCSDGVVNAFHPGQRHLINPGSVGQPRDGDPRASFALIDTDTASASIIRVKYDVASTADAIRKAGLPEFLARRLEYGI
jgi:putative phosphoesterase